MIGMGHLNLVAEIFDPSTDDARFPFWQDLHQVIGVGMKKHQVQDPGFIAATHPVRKTAVVRRQVSVHTKSNGGHRTIGRLCNLW